MEVAMISRAVKSHWKLVWRTFNKAVKVTLQDIKQSVKAVFYSAKKSDYLSQQRTLFRRLERYEGREG
mgnify:CR=1 FL=1